MTLHERAIMAALKERRMTKADLANLRGVTRMAIQDMMKADARISTIEETARVLGIKTSTLIRKGENDAQRDMADTEQH
jgi:predicted transcriptional regulator